VNVPPGSPQFCCEVDPHEKTLASRPAQVDTLFGVFDCVAGDDASGLDGTQAGRAGIFTGEWWAADVAQVGPSTLR
jgi:hypothetical protein